MSRYRPLLGSFCAFSSRRLPYVRVVSASWVIVALPLWSCLMLVLLLLLVIFLLLLLYIYCNYHYMHTLLYINIISYICYHILILPILLLVIFLLPLIQSSLLWLCISPPVSVYYFVILIVYNFITLICSAHTTSMARLSVLGEASFLSCSSWCFFHFFLVHCQGPRTESVVCCPDFKTTWDKLWFVIFVLNLNWILSVDKTSKFSV